MAAIDGVDLVKASELDQVESIAAGDFFIVIAQGQTAIITYEQMSAILTGSSITPEQVRDKLASLSGANRLDASAIKNISGGGAGVVRIQLDSGGVDCSIVGVGNDEGWDFDFAAGVATVTVPEASHILNISVKGVAGNATYSEGGYIGAFKLRIIQSGEPLTHDTEYATAIQRKCFVKDGSNSADVSPETPLIDDPGVSQNSVDEISAGIIGIVFDQLASNFSGGFTVGF